MLAAGGRGRRSAPPAIQLAWPVGSSCSRTSSASLCGFFSPSAAMLRALPAQPLLSLLFPGPAAQLLDLRQLEHELDRAGQQRYCRLRLPWARCPAAAAAAPRLAVLQSSLGSWLATLYGHSHECVILVQHAVAGGDAFGGFSVPGCQARPGVSHQESPTGVVAAWQWGRNTFTAVTAEGPDGAPTCLVQQGILPALDPRQQGGRPEDICRQPTGDDSCLVLAGLACQGCAVRGRCLRAARRLQLAVFLYADSNAADRLVVA